MNSLKAKYRAKIYKNLSECFRVPDQNFYGLLEDLKETLELVYPELVKGLSPFNNTSEKVAEMKIEHARLFIGPFTLLAPPYGSMYLDHHEHLMTNSTVDVLRRYEEENMDVAIQEIPDHLCIELEYMYYLVFREMEALEHIESDYHNNGTEISLENAESSPFEKSLHEIIFNYRLKQYDFLKKHLSRWLPEFEKKVHEHANLPFFSQLATVTNEFIVHDLRKLKRNLMNVIQ